MHIDPVFMLQQWKKKRTAWCVRYVDILIFDIPSVSGWRWDAKYLCHLQNGKYPLLRSYSNRFFSRCNILVIYFMETVPWVSDREISPDESFEGFSIGRVCSGQKNFAHKQQLNRIKSPFRAISSGVLVYGVICRARKVVRFVEEVGAHTHTHTVHLIVSAFAKHQRTMSKIANIIQSQNEYTELNRNRNRTEQYLKMAFLMWFIDLMLRFQCLIIVHARKFRVAAAAAMAIANHLNFGGAMDGCLSCSTAGQTLSVSVRMWHNDQWLWCAFACVWAFLLSLALAIIIEMANNPFKQVNIWPFSGVLFFLSGVFAIRSFCRCCRCYFLLEKCVWRAKQMWQMNKNEPKYH